MTRDPKDTLLEDVCEQISRNGFDGMAKVLEILMNAAMVLERSKALGAAPYERTEERVGYANGFKPRSFQTRMGEVQLQIPQVRGIAFYPGCLVSMIGLMEPPMIGIMEPLPCIEFGR